MPILGALVGFFAFTSLVSALPASANAPTMPVGPTYSVAMTGYNAVPAQTDGDPFTTASGAFSNPEVVAARSQDLGQNLPFGTIVAIDGPSVPDGTCGYDVVGKTIGYRVIADTMNRKFTDRIDVLFSTKDNYIMPNGTTKNAGIVLGVCHDVSIRVVGYVDISNPANLPKTQAALAALVGGSNDLALK